MPAIVWGAVAFAAGLIAGFGHMWNAALLAVAFLALLSVSDSVPVAAILCMVAGFVLAVSSPATPAHFGTAQSGADSTQFAEHARLRAARNIDVAFGEDAPLAKALLVADQSEIPRDIKDRYADAGIVHMLSISGMHVTIIAGSVALVLQLLRLPVRVASITSVCIVVLYVWMLGFPPPAVRSAAMVSVVVGSRALQRHTSRWAALALGALLPLLKPDTVTDLGYQLSVGGMAALIAAGALIKRTRVARWTGWRAALARAVTASTIATLVTAPLVAATFGRLSIVAPVTNLLADPVLALAQPMLFLAMVLAPWPDAARFVASASHPLLSAFDAIARAGASVPHAAIAVSPSGTVAVMTGIAAVATVAACVSRFPARAALVASGALCAAVWIG